jgi:type VII secretion integral membrane protein EccD
MGASGLVRVTVASQTRRVDLMLPSAIPVAELVPELARSVGLLDPSTAHGGFRLVTQGGRVLAGESGLAVQGIEDGRLLTVTAGADDVPPPVYDDVAEAMADAVERDVKPWSPGSKRRIVLLTAALLMALGAVALFLQASSVAGAAAISVALVLTAGAIVVSHARPETDAAVVMAWLGTSYAAVAGFALAPEGVMLGLPMAYAGAGATLTGVSCLVGLGRGRTLVLPPVVGGAICLAAGLVVRAGAVDLAVLLTGVLTLLVMVGNSFPWLALGATGTTVDQLSSIRDVTAQPGDIDLDRVSADTRVAHQILVSMTVTVGMLLVITGPLAVSLGLAGALLAAGCCLVVMLRARRHRVGSEMLLGLLSGVAGLVSVAISLFWLHPGWHLIAAATLVSAGGVGIAVALLPSAGSPRWGRAGDLSESVTMLSLLPLLVVATGIYAAVRG